MGDFAYRSVKSGGKTVNFPGLKICSEDFTADFDDFMAYLVTELR